MNGIIEVLRYSMGAQIAKSEVIQLSVPRSDARNVWLNPLVSVIKKVI